MSDPKDTLDKLLVGSPETSPPETESSLADTMPGKTSPLAKAGSAVSKRNLAMAQTLPHGGRAYGRADTQPAATTPAATFENEDVITSTTAPPSGRADAAPCAGVYGSTLASSVSESEARRILTARFAAAGFALRADYPFQEADLAVILDGYDPDRRIGFSYVSHTDADVVTDFDEATDLAFQQLAADSTAWVLVVHDSDTPNEDALERRIDAFFVELNRPAANRQ